MDNAIIGRLTDITEGLIPGQSRLSEDMAVLRELIDLCQRRRHTLYVSPDAEAEIMRLEAPARQQELLDMLRQFETLAVPETPEWVSTLEAIEKFLLGKTHISRAGKREAVHWDARHLATCRVSGCDLFLTTDYASIWAYRRDLKRLFGISVRRPMELYQELDIPESVAARTSRAIILVDLDAFFPSVEELLDPTIKGKPIIVGGRPGGRGVVASASYEARKYGVHSAMPVTLAARKCPQCIFLPVRIDVYWEYSQRVMSLLREYSDLVEQVSIDEAFVDVTKPMTLAEARRTAQEIQRRIKEEVGLPCSIGMASNKLVAKIACESGKPGGLVVIPPGRERSLLEPLPVGRLWGVGPKTRSRLTQMGVATVGDLARVPQEKLMLEFGQRGIWMHQNSLGIYESPVVVEHETKSVGRETTFERDKSDFRQLADEFRILASSTASSLRELNMKGRTVTIKLRFPDFQTITRSHTRESATDSPREIMREALALLNKNWAPPAKLRLIGVQVSNLMATASEEVETVP